MLRIVRRFAQMASRTPVEDAIRCKLTAALSPTTLRIYNDSAGHSHHKAMEGSVSKETHFRLIVTSAEFNSKPQLARHRIINTLLKEELEREGGIHALQISTLTPAEEEKLGKGSGEGES